MQDRGNYMDPNSLRFDESPPWEEVGKERTDEDSAMEMDASMWEKSKHTSWRSDASDFTMRTK
jgi:hypothetical protein